MRAKKNLFATYGFIIINILINLFVVRLAVREFGSSLYAFIVLAFSFITYVETFNLGVYISNRTQIPMRGPHANIYTVASFKFLSLISIILFIIWSGIYFLWGDTLLAIISNETALETIKTGKLLIGIGVSYGIIKIPLSLVLSAFSGHDLVDIEKKYNGLQQIIKISSLIVVILFKLNILVYMILFTGLGTLLLIVANIHYYKCFVVPKTKSYLKYSKKISGKFITKNSFKFYVFTMASVVVWSTDHLLVSMFFNPRMVTDYHINFSIYNAAFLFITAIAGALIANYGNMMRDKDFDKLNFRLNLSIYTTMAIAIAIGFGGVLFSEEIINLWVGEGHFISLELCIAFSFFGLTLGLSSVVNTMLSLFANTKIITTMTISEALLNLFLSVVLAKMIGVLGIALATGIAALITIVIPGAIVLKNEFNKAVSVEIIPIVVQLILGSFFIGLALNFSLDLIQKIFVFLVYSLLSIGLMFLIRREYLNSYVKIIWK